MVHRATVAVRGSPPEHKPFAGVPTAIACSADDACDVCAALLRTTHRGTYWTALVGAVVTAARPEDLQSMEAAIKGQGCIFLLPAWARAANQHLPGAAASPPRSPCPAWALEASAQVPGPATAAVAPQPTAPPTPQYPRGHTPQMAWFCMPWPISPAPALLLRLATPTQFSLPAP